MTDKSTAASLEALFRFQLLGAVRAMTASGRSLAAAIILLAGQAHTDLRGRARRVSARTLYRWLHAYERAGLPGLEPRPRPRTQRSRVVPDALLDFCERERESDRRASLPELLRRARASGIVDGSAHIDRSSLWRALRRMGVATSHQKVHATRDSRAFAYPHRMQMVLADGNHFRAGPERCRRVALIFLDDATRYALRGSVGTSESAEWFLRGLYDTLDQHGRMRSLYLDKGPGFISGDTIEVCAQLVIPIVHGETRYPEGHGKIERLNRTLNNRLLRGLSQPTIDSAPGHLTVRLNEELAAHNRTPHEALDQQSPLERWQSDSLPLDPISDRSWLRDRFRVRLPRRVTRHNLVPIDGIDYEMPTGYAGEAVTLYRNVLEPDTIEFLHDQRRIRLYPVDREQNAYDRRARGKQPEATDAQDSPTDTAANREFEQRFGSILDDDGGYPDRRRDDDHEDEQEDD